MFLTLQISHQVPVLVYILIVFPFLIIAPGFVLTRTFIHDTEKFSFSELWFLRVALSIAVNTINIMILSLAHHFTLLNLCSWNVFVTLAFCVMTRFKFLKKTPPAMIDWRDFYVVFLVFTVAVFSFWPSELLREPYTLAMSIVRGKSLELSQWWDVDGNGALAVLWQSVFIVLFGPRVALLGVPIFAILSIAGTYFCAKRLIGNDRAAIASSLLQMVNFVQIWFSRTTDAFIIAQFLFIASLYLYMVCVQHRQKCILIFFLLYLLLFSVAAQTFWILPLIIGVFFLLQNIVTKNNSERGLVYIKSLLVIVCFILFYQLMKQHVLWFQMLNLFYWLLAAIGLWSVFSRLKENGLQTEQMFVLAMTICAAFVFGRDITSEPFMKKSSIIVPALIPIICLLSGFAYRWLEQVKNMFRICIAFFAVILCFELTSHWPLLWVRDHNGSLSFYQRFVKNIGPNDVLLSDDVQLCHLLKNVYGAHCYRIDAYQNFDQAFKEELRDWISGGGQVLYVSDKKAIEIEGIQLKLDNITSVQTPVIGGTQTFPKKEQMISLKLYLYQVQI
ncbi:MAG: hypothetical protein Q8Q33_02495 [Chlamydiota bacterium]|nr:hypothetical protein [Chlamydiota bacterium]